MITSKPNLKSLKTEKRTDSTKNKKSSINRSIIEISLINKNKERGTDGQRQYEESQKERRTRRERGGELINRSKVNQSMFYFTSVYIEVILDKTKTKQKQKHTTHPFVFFAPIYILLKL